MSLRGPLLALATWLGLGCAFGQAPDRPRIMTAGELQAARGQISPRLLTRFAKGLEVDSHQSFVIPGSDGQSLQLVAVRYTFNNTTGDNTYLGCGVVILDATRPAKFVPTVGFDWMDSEQCGGLDAVGFIKEESGGFPRVLLLYTAGTIHSEVKEPVVLDYHAAAKSYAGNEKVSMRMTNLSGPLTIAAMKRALAPTAGKP